MHVLCEPKLSLTLNRDWKLNTGNISKIQIVVYCGRCFAVCTVVTFLPLSCSRGRFILHYVLDRQGF